MTDAEREFVIRYVSEIYAATGSRKALETCEAMVRELGIDVALIRPPRKPLRLTEVDQVRIIEETLDWHARETARLQPVLEKLKRRAA